MKYSELQELRKHLKETLGYSVEHGKSTIGNLRKRMVARKKSSMPLGQKVHGRYVAEGDGQDQSENNEKTVTVSPERKKNLSVNFEPVLNDYTQTTLTKGK